MNERLSIGLVALVSLLALWLAPWAAINRETGARSAVLLLPDRVIDFTGRTAPVDVSGLGAVLVLSILGLLVIVAGALLRGRARYGTWLAGGLLLVVITSWGLTRFSEAIRVARVAAVVEVVADAVENPRDSYDVPALEAVAAEAPGRSVEASVRAAREAGLTIRRLPYNGSGFGLAAFLSLLTGGLCLLFGLQYWSRLGLVIDRFLATVAVPLTSILLALLAAAAVILSLQPTPVGREVEIAGPFMALVGRLDTLWYAYLTLFADSLGTFGGAMEALKFATPLIFTGLAVAFGFQAGLFNIGAPGQMVLGAIFAMLVGVYLPGPRLIALPAAVLAAALGGGLWGALPGWLKARFGANEVITTILLNFVAASALLFILSSSPVFAAAALRVIWLLGLVVVGLIVAALIPWSRRLLGRAPRLSFAVVGVLVLAGMVVAGWPRAGDAPVTVNLPFKVPGSEPKSLEVRPEARLAQVPYLVGIDPRLQPGVNQVEVNLALGLAPLAALLGLWGLPRLGARLHAWRWRLPAALALGVGVYALGAGLGLASYELGMPPTKLNLSFLLALLMAVFMQYFMWRTKWGYELRAVGVAPEAAEYGGANIASNVVLAMAMSGAFAGLTACHYVLGGALEDFSLRQALPTNDGFDGIAVALLGGNTPLGVVLSALLFGILKNGGSVLNIAFSDLTRDVVNMILALVVLFIAAKGFLPDRLTNPLQRAEAFDPHIDPPSDPLAQPSDPLDPPGKPLRSAEEGDTV